TEVAHPRDDQVAAFLVGIGQCQPARAPAFDGPELPERVEPRPQSRKGDAQVACGHHATMSPVRSAGRTGTRVSATPEAARMAATTAGVDETVGGSPTPFAPKGAPGSGSSITV